MEKEDFQAKLERALDGALTLTDKAQREQVERLADERLQKLVEATASLERSKASLRFGWALFFIGWVVVVIAIYMRVDGRELDSLVTLMLSLIPLLVGGVLIHRYTATQRQRAKSIEQLHAGSK